MFSVRSAVGTGKQTQIQRNLDFYIVYLPVNMMILHIKYNPPLSQFLIFIKKSIQNMFNFVPDYKATNCFSDDELVTNVHLIFQ